MNIDMQTLHQVILDILYAATALTTFVVVERALFYWATLRDARKLEAVMTHTINNVHELPAELIQRDSLPAEVVRKMLATKAELKGRSDMEDFAESLYIASRAKLHRHVWLLDTIVTAAPLLGLLGTILGIIDTFTALASAGVSDPSAVSKGIGTALFATAMGISVALYGLLFNNMFQVRIDGITEHLKILMLRSGIGGPDQSASKSSEEPAGHLAYAD